MYLKYITFQRNPSIKFVRVFTKNYFKRNHSESKEAIELKARMTTLRQVCLKSFKEINAE